MKYFSLVLILVCFDAATSQAQIPGADEAIKSASASGWTAVLVCVMCLCALIGVGWLIRQIWTRLTGVEDFQKSTLVDLHTKTEAACVRSVTALEKTSDALVGLTTALARDGLRVPAPASNSRPKRSATA